VGIWQVSLEVFFSCYLSLVFFLYSFIYWIKKTCFSMVMPSGGIGPIHARWSWPGTLRIPKSLPLFPSVSKDHETQRHHLCEEHKLMMRHMFCFILCMCKKKLS
jgi:hypothetical protein